MTVFLDNFTGIDRGYFFSGGLVDRLYNPLAGAHIVRHLHAALPEGCDLGDWRLGDAESGRQRQHHDWQCHSIHVWSGEHLAVRR